MFNNREENCLAQISVDAISWEEEGEAGGGGMEEWQKRRGAFAGLIRLLFIFAIEYQQN